ncbi:DUF736 domain-containing protein [Magnetospira sp. QH-2]|uniref:DUF736 domain-containing protein n=1 Tax=Magnetospira sp. (strain QH-2) TaxID=1288970 RepID=UPI0005FA1A09|nr:DUF736 domain-containing protein [Magnetospira sp. QH-2]
MATIGTFQKTGKGYKGSIKTLTVEAEVEIIAVETSGDKEPDFRVKANGDIDLGAGWTRVSKKTKREYVSLKLQDPTFAGPIYANLTEQDGTYSLIWS